MSNKRPYESGNSGNPANIRLQNVTPYWLTVSDQEK
jgi:hypothetical protein